MACQNALNDVFVYCDVHGSKSSWCGGLSGNPKGIGFACALQRMCDLQQCSGEYNCLYVSLLLKDQKNAPVYLTYFRAIT